MNIIFIGTSSDVPGPGQYDIKETVPSMDKLKNFGFLNRSKRFISPKSGNIYYIFF